MPFGVRKNCATAFEDGGPRRRNGCWDSANARISFTSGSLRLQRITPVLRRKPSRLAPNGRFPLR